MAFILTYERASTHAGCEAARQAKSRDFQALLASQTTPNGYYIMTESGGYRAGTGKFAKRVEWICAPIGDTQS